MLMFVCAEKARRVHRDAASVEAVGEGPGVVVVGGAVGTDGADATSLELAEVAEVPAWRELWYGSLEALHREPSINNTQEDVLAQLGAVAFLHCPVRNLGERGVSTTTRERAYLLCTHHLLVTHASVQVSWVRRRDWHIISSGMLMYTNDERFQVPRF